MKTIRSKKHNFEFELPTCAEETTTKFFIDFATQIEKGELEYLSHLTGIERDELIKKDVTDLDFQVFGTLKFMDSIFLKVGADTGHPETIKIKDEVIAIPKNLEFETLGQKIDFKNLVYKNDELTTLDLIKAVPESVSIYLANKSSLTKDELIQEVNKMCVLDSIPIFNHFFLKFLELQRNGLKLLKANTQT